jgi:hypothetical protein
MMTMNEDEKKKGKNIFFNENYEKEKKNFVFISNF